MYKGECLEWIIEFYLPFLINRETQCLMEISRNHGHVVVLDHILVSCREESYRNGN